MLHYLPPTDFVYQNHVPARYYGYLIAKYFASRFTYLREDEWVSRILTGSITVNGKVVDPGYVLKEHDHIVTCMGPCEEPPANRTLTVLYEDARIRVFNKAAPIPVHPSGRYFKNSMTEVLKEVYPDEVPRPVQRLDAMTTGVLVFARTREAAAFLMSEFAENRVRKEYLALVEGIPGEKKFVIDAPIGKMTGSARGIGKHTVNPKPAVTEVEWLTTIDNRSLLKVVPRSGRTNQIRVHLASAGLPIVNDSVYGQRDVGSRLPALADLQSISRAEEARRFATGRWPGQRDVGFPLPVSDGVPELPVGGGTLQRAPTFSASADQRAIKSRDQRFGLHAHRLSFRCFERDVEITASWPAQFQPFTEAWQ